MAARMMMRSTFLLALATSFMPIVAHPLERRAITFATEWVTIIETDIVYFTVWVYPDGADFSTTTPATTAFASTAISTVLPVPAPTTSSAMSTHVPPAYVSKPLKTSTSTTTNPTPAPISVYTPAPAPTSISTYSIYTPPTSTSDYVVPVVPTSVSNTGSSGVVVGITYTGDMTYYDVGLGSCGWTSTASQSVVAIPVGMMDNGANPNNNPLCGQKVSISYGGKSTTASIVDTCMGCSNGALDMSDSLFSYFADMSLGRVPGMTWELLN